MSLEILKDIKQIELKAEREERETRLKARNILADVKKEAYEIYESSIVQTEKQIKEIMFEAEKKAEKEIELINREIENECEQIKASAMQKIEEAVGFITNNTL